MFPALIFVALLAVLLGVLALWMRPSRDVEILNKRLDDLYHARPHAEETSTAIRIASNTGDAVTALQKALRHRAFDGLRRLLQQSQSNLTPAGFLLRSAACAFALVLCAALPGWPLPLRLAALTLGALLPTLWLQRRRKRRLKKFEDTLPDAADLMARALRAGHSVQQALELVAEGTQGPVAEEFLQLHQEQKFGVPLKDALRSLADRVPSGDLQFLVTAIVVQKETGGDLIEILDRTTEVIRERLRVGREVMTYTAQGRLTGWILSALPVVLLGLTAVLTPAYSEVLFHDPTGQKLLMAAAALIVFGSLIIRRVVKVEV